MVSDLNDRSRDIFRQIVESYLETGEPVGSRTLSQRLPLNLSAASIRNVMADLEQMGLIASPHASAGRVPTHIGLRLFVDGLLEVGDLSAHDRADIDARVAGSGGNLEDVLTQATSLLSGLSRCAGVVTAPKLEAPLKHIEFVALGPGRALVVIVTEAGNVENRAIDIPAGMTISALTEAGNYLNSRLRGRTIEDARAQILAEINERRSEIDELSARVIEAGLASWAGEDARDRTLIVRGRANLLEDLKAAEDLERIRLLFDDLETRSDVLQLLDLAKAGEGVRIFIGAENKLFSLSGSSLVLAPFMNSRQRVVGVIGVIGPTRLNYARIVPMVDYTAKLVGRILG